MKYPFITLAFSLSLLGGCQGGERFAEFPAQSTLTIKTEDYGKVSGKTCTFRNYLTPFAKVEKDAHTVLFGFIFHEPEWIDGVAYLIDEEEKVVDTLVVSGIDPPNELWAEMGQSLMLLEDGGMMEEGPLPPGRTESYWVDTLEYRISESGFEIVK